MSSSEVHELAVRVHPEGAEQTEDALDNVQGQFEETAATTEETAGMLGDAAEKLTGFMGAIVAGLTVAAAGLLSKVPVFQEVASALDLLLTSLGLQIDRTLRPAIGALSNAIVEISAAISTSSPAVKDLIGILSTVGVIGGGVVGVLSLIGVTLSGPLVAGILIVVGALATLLTAWRNNWFGIRDITMQIVQIIKSAVGTFADFLKGVWRGLLDALNGDWNKVWRGILEFTEDVLNTLRDVFILFGARSLAVLGKFGVDVRAIFEKLWTRIRTGFELVFDLVVKAVKEGANLVLGVVKGLANGVISVIQKIINSLENLINAAAETASKVSGVSIPTVNLGGFKPSKLDREDLPFQQTRSVDQIFQAAQQRTTRRDRRTAVNQQRRKAQIDKQISELIQAMQQNEIKLTTELDSQKVAEETEPFLDRNVNNRGR